MMPRVPARSAKRHARHDLGIIVDQIEHAGLCKRHEVLRQVAGAIALMRMRRVVPFAAMHDVARVGEARDHADRRCARAVKAADMIEVQVAGEHDVDVVRRQPGFGERMVEVIARARARRSRRSWRPSCRRSRHR